MVERDRDVLTVNRRDRRIAWWHRHPRILYATMVGPLYVAGGLAFVSVVSGRLGLINLATPVLLLALVVYLALDAAAAWQSRHEDRPGWPTSERLGRLGRDLDRMRRDLRTASTEVERLADLAEQLERDAGDNLALSQMTSEQFEAWRRDQQRTRRIDWWRNAAFTVVGAVLSLFGVYWLGP